MQTAGRWMQPAAKPVAGCEQRGRASGSELPATCAAAPRRCGKRARTALRSGRRSLRDPRRWSRSRRSAPSARSRGWPLAEAPIGADILPALSEHPASVAAASPAESGALAPAGARAMLRAAAAADGAPLPSSAFCDSAFPPCPAESRQRRSAQGAGQTCAQQGLFFFFCDISQIQTGLSRGLCLKRSVQDSFSEEFASGRAIFE